MYLFYHYKFHGKVKDKEHLKLRCLVQVGPGQAKCKKGNCDAWTQQSNNSCVTKRNPLSLLTVYPLMFIVVYRQYN